MVADVVTATVVEEEGATAVTLVPVEEEEAVAMTVVIEGGADSEVVIEEDPVADGETSRDPRCSGKLCLYPMPRFDI